MRRSLAILAGAMLTTPAAAQSLMDAAPEAVQRGDLGLSPYGSPRKEPIKRYDHITVIVDERTRSSVTADLRSDRRSRVEGRLPNVPQFDGDNDGLPDLKPGQPGLEANLDARLREENTAGTKREGIVTDRITAIVVDVKENGDLVIEGMKDRGINNEEETIRLSGIVSPQAVSASREVRSDKIAHLQLTYTGSGAVGDKTEPGFMGKILGKLWPF